MVSDASQAELARLQKETKGQAAEAEAPNQGQDILEQVEQLGHYPKRFKKPTTDKERAENSLAKKISKEWSKLSDATQAELARLQKETKGKDAEAEAPNQGQDILEQVEQLGHYPKRFKKPTTDKERAENSLAEEISKQWSMLSDASQAELARLQKETKGKNAQAMAARRAQDILERLRAFGKWPQEHEYSHASNTDIITEARLALQTHDNSWQT